MNITVIRLSCGDTSRCKDLAHIFIAAWRSSFHGILPNEVIEQYTQFEPCSGMFHQILSSGEGTMYLAEQQGMPAGLLYWLPEGENARVEALLTTPEVWGKGIAAGLMKQALADTAEFSAVTVWPFAENHRARRFYEKHGFLPTGRTRMGDAAEMEYRFKFEQ